MNYTGALLNHLQSIVEDCLHCNARVHRLVPVGFRTGEEADRQFVGERQQDESHQKAAQNSISSVRKILP